MKLRILKIIVLIMIIASLVYAKVGIKLGQGTRIVEAIGGLTVNFHVPGTDPIFTITNGKPGDVYGPKPVDVTNNSGLTRLVAVRGVKTGGDTLDNGLEIEIKDGATLIYGPVKLSDFLAAAEVALNPINNSQNKTYNITVRFPSAAGNEFKNKSVVFDLIFGVVAANHLVINEVYYQVDPNHGQDKKHEWVELYNPTGHDVSLKNWTLVDNSGKERKIHPNKTIKAGGFALLSKDASTWRFWNRPGGILVELGSEVGDGLDNDTDHLFLKDPQGVVVDDVDWTPGLTTLTQSLERLIPGVDTDSPADWAPKFPPTPGN